MKTNESLPLLFTHVRPFLCCHRAQSPAAFGVKTAIFRLNRLGSQLRYIDVRERFLKLVALQEPKRHRRKY